MSCDGDNEYILIAKKCQQLILFFFDFFSEFFTFLCILLYCMKIDFYFFVLFCFLILFCFVFFVSFVSFIFIYFFFKTLYGSSGTGGIEARETAWGVWRGPRRLCRSGLRSGTLVKRSNERERERNPETPLAKKICALSNKKRQNRKTSGSAFKWLVYEKRLRNRFFL